MDNITCSICKDDIESRFFGRHLNSEHKITLARYHQENFPRFDLLTGEEIVFENSQQYYTTFYLDKQNMGKHLISLPIEQAGAICKEMFTAYKQYKNSIWAPSQVETRTTVLPSPTLFDRLGLDYNNICKSAGLKQRFNYDVKLSYIDRNIGFACDTREQKKLPINIKKICKIDYGDYYANYNPFKIFIERKSGPDLAQTCTANLARFKRELTRAVKDDGYILIACERPLNEMMDFEHQSYSKHSYVKGSYLFHCVREVLQEFSNCQCVFCNSREHLCLLMEKFYRCEYNPRRIDWQYFLDRKII